MFKHYLKSAEKNLGREKFYTLVSIIGLAVAMAVCTVVLLYIDYESHYDRHHADVQRIFRVAVTVTDASQRVSYATTPSSLALALRSDFPQIACAARLMTNPETLVRSDRDKAFLERGVFHADPQLLQVFKFTLVQGHVDDFLTRPGTVVVTEEVAHRYFGQTAVLGQWLDFGYGRLEIAGIIKNPPRNSHLRCDFLLPIPTGRRVDWSAHGWDDVDGQTGLTYTYIKLKEHADLDNFRSQLQRISERYAGGLQQKKSGVEHIYSLQPVADIHLHSDLKNELRAPGDPTSLIALAILALLLIVIACMNYIHFTVARSSARLKEIAMRKVLGATRRQLRQQVILESSLLIAISFVLSLVLIELVLPWFNEIVRTELTLELLARIPVIVTLIGFLTAVIIFAGGYPAVILSNTPATRLFRGEYLNGLQTPHLRKTLIVFQFAAAVILILCTILSNRWF
ncbi:ABC transporter permease [candidate division KSB1 bacterium]|nr:ABC transporter permease [candidate division KSB1 bacterium]